MAWDTSWLLLHVVGWSQTIRHGENWPQYQFRFKARTSDDEELVFGADGYRFLRNIPVYLALVRGQPEELPERGVGILAYNPEKPAHNDIDGNDEFVSGWFWVPEALYDEIWAQAREHRYDECVVELEFAPVEHAGPTLRWNTEKNKVASITCAGVRFERKLELPADPKAPVANAPKKRWPFS